METQAKYLKTALTGEQMEKRHAFALAVEKLKITPQWYFNNVVWTDLCNSILPLSEKKATEMALARKGSKGWCSDGCELSAIKLKGRKELLKQRSWDTRRVWWSPFLMRGRLHVTVFDDAFPREVPEGAKMLVPKIRAAINLRFPGATSKPSWVFVDRGKGFYNTGTGKITNEFKEALRDSRLKAFWGDDASVQPGHLQEMMLHETSVSWLRYRLAQTLPAREWEESSGDFASRLRRCCADINEKLDVDGLCRAFPKRIAQLKENQGGRLKE